MIPLSNQTVTDLIRLLPELYEYITGRENKDLNRKRKIKQLIKKLERAKYTQTQKKETRFKGET